MTFGFVKLFVGFKLRTEYRYVLHVGIAGVKGDEKLSFQKSRIGLWDGRGASADALLLGALFINAFNGSGKIACLSNCHLKYELNDDNLSGNVSKGFGETTGA